MSEDQAVAEEADDQRKADAEATGAQEQEPSLDDIFNEYDEKSGDTEQRQQKTESSRESSGLTPEEIEEIRAERQRKAVDSAIRDVKGDDDWDDELVEGILHARAVRDPRISEAFMNRSRNPERWQSVAKAIRKDIAKKLSPVDQRATDDHEAVAAAVRGASTKAPEEEAPDFSGMTDSEFERMKSNL